MATQSSSSPDADLFTSSLWSQNDNYITSASTSSATGLEPIVWPPQLRQLRRHYPVRLDALPRTYSQALQCYQHAVVITTARAPHHIVHVNTAWEQLCEYTKPEVLGQSLSIVQHHSNNDNSVSNYSNVDVATRLVQRLVTTQSRQEAYFVQLHTNTGRPFVNYVQVAPLYWDENRHDQADFFVGILQAVNRAGVPLQLMRE